MATFNDSEAKAACQAICDKRNKHVLKTHMFRWKPLFVSATVGWQPAFRPAIEGLKKGRESNATA